MVQAWHLVTPRSGGLRPPGSRRANVCDRCRRSLPSFDDHASCPQCRVAAGICHVDVSNPCTICQNWTTRTWNKLRKSLVDARLRTIRRGRQHWTSAFPYIEVWVTNKPASTASSSEPGSEISSFVDSELQKHLKKNYFVAFPMCDFICRQLMG